jgi:hypothetical protein
MLSNPHLAFICLLVVGMNASLWSELASACAMCQTVLPRGDDPLARGLFWSMLILLTAPFVVTGAIGGWVYYHYRKSPSSGHTSCATNVPFSRTPQLGDLS